MSKKPLILTVTLVIIAAAAAGGWFWWKNAHPAKGSADDYIIKQSSTGEKIVENKKAGLTFEVPDGWREEKIDELEGSVIIYSPDTEFIKPKTVPLIKGCLLGVATIYKKVNFEEIKGMVEDIHFGLGVKLEEFEVIEVNNQQALRNTFDTIEIGRGTTVYLPYKDKFYSFAAYAGSEDEEQCLQDFDQFLKTVSYK